MIMIVAQRETRRKAGVSLSHLIVDDPATKQRDWPHPSVKALVLRICLDRYKYVSVSCKLFDLI